MKLIAALFAALVFFVLAPGVAMPAPNPVSNPEHTFVLIRVLPNQNTHTLQTWVEDGTFTSEQLVRQIAAQAANQQRINNPAWVLELYGPTNGGPHTDDDRIWSTLTG